MKNITKLVLVTILLIAPVLADAASFEYPYIVRSVRALGMGDAYYAKSDDKYAVFYNPAGLTRVDEKWRVDILPLQLGINQGGIDSMNDLNDVDFDNESEVADYLRGIIGEYQHVDFNFMPAFYKPNFMIGGFASMKLTAIARNKAYPQMGVDLNTDYGGVVGFSRTFLENDALAVGLGLKFVNRVSLSEVYTASDLTSETFDDDIEDGIKEGSAMLGDLGFIYTFPHQMEPRIALAVNNIGDAELGEAADLATTVNLSAGISPQFGPLTTDFIIDYRDISRQIDADDDMAKRINVGGEVWLYKFLALRAGLHQGWPTFGATLNLYLLRVDYAHYYEEMGAHAGQDGDERHTVEITLGF